MDTDQSPQDTPISPRFARLAILAEKYVLPWIYAFLAWQRLSAIRLHYLNHRAYARFHAIDPALKRIFYAGLTKDALLFVMMVFTGLMLLFSRPPTSLPNRLKHIVTPLAMSYYFILYGMLGSLPSTLRESLMPSGLQIPLAVLAVILSLMGYSISIWALLYLRRSFSILVSVRDVVSGGPYAFVRHPIYLGYLIDQCGLLLANSSVGMLFLVGGFLLLLVQRARIEEEMLSQASEGYRSYAKQTGFLLPLLKKRELRTASL